MCPLANVKEFKIDERGLSEDFWNYFTVHVKANVKMNTSVVNPLCEKVPAIQILEAIDRLKPDVNPVVKCVKCDIITVL